MAVDFAQLSLKLDGKIIDRIGADCTDKSFKFVGHYLDEYLSWDSHIKHVIGKLSSANYAISRSKNFLPLNIRKTLYNSMFKSHLEFGILAFGCAPQYKLKKVCTQQKKCIRHIANVSSRAHSDPLFHKLSIMKFDDVFRYSVNNFLHQYRTDRLPPSFNGMFTLMRDTDDRNSRDSFYNYSVSVPIKKSLSIFPRVIFIPVWNSLSSVLQCIESHKCFKSDCMKEILNRYGEFRECDNLNCEECY